MYAYVCVCVCFKEETTRRWREKSLYIFCVVVVYTWWRSCICLLIYIYTFLIYNFVCLKPFLVIPHCVSKDRFPWLSHYNLQYLHILSFYLLRCTFLFSFGAVVSFLFFLFNYCVGSKFYSWFTIYKRYFYGTAF